MKIAFSLILTNDNLRPLLAMIKEAGFDGVEPTFHPDGMLNPLNFQAGAALLKKEADKAGLAIPSLRGGPLFWDVFGAEQESRREQALTLASQALATLRLLEGKVLLIVPGKLEKGLSYHKLHQNSLATAAKIAQIAEPLQLIVGLENVENNFLLSPREWTIFIDEINHPCLKIYLDVGNIVYLDLGEPADWIRALGQQRICRIHFKDCLVKNRLLSKSRTIAPLLKGSIEWLPVVNALKAIGYDDWISVELPLPDEGQKEFFLQTIQAARAICSGTI